MEYIYNNDLYLMVDSMWGQPPGIYVYIYVYILTITPIH